MDQTINLKNSLPPYHPERARSRLISEAKQGRARLVLGWETAWEYRVLRKKKKKLSALTSSSCVNVSVFWTPALLLCN